MRNVFYPRLRWAWVPALLGYSVMGALIAGAYGVVHDQITFSIGPEYFTRLKFAQFHYADFGWPQRVFVGEVGFLATWWVGFISGWFLARTLVPAVPRELVSRGVWQGFAVIIGCAMVAWVAGFMYGRWRMSGAADLSSWAAIAEERGVQDLRGFVRVAYIHNASYIGGAVGFVIALVRARKMAKR